MKLDNDIEVVVIPTAHTTKHKKGFDGVDLIEIGEVFHELGADEYCSDCEIGHIYDIPKCDQMVVGSIVRREVAEKVATPCPKPECFGEVVEEES